ncbi:MAG: FtsL-like putative cell division protein [Bacteroidota bacterium]|nr:FtsL-like putative cell division protein [Bacteroidota bacterium]
MEETQNNETEPITSEQEVRPVKKQKRMRKSIHDVLGGDVLSRELVLRNFPLLLYISVLAMLYIGNTYYSEKTYKKIEKVTAELKELRFQYITTKSGLMYFTKQTEIEKRAQGIGLKEPVLPPYKIYYSKRMMGNVKDSAQEQKQDEKH